jgi:carotenoid 1,2-hydratase
MAMVERTENCFVVGRNIIERTPEHIAIHVSESSLTGARPISGRIVVHPSDMTERTYNLDAAERHRWHPVAPVGAIEVVLEDPAVKFVGSAYHDANNGDEPIEAALKHWNWSRLDASGDTVVLYDGVRSDASPFSLALRFMRDGRVDSFEPPPERKLPPTFGWLCPRAIRSGDEHAGRVVRTLENAPFYSRSLVETSLFGAPVTGVHESLVLDRFTTRWMQWMLPYRIKREQ